MTFLQNLHTHTTYVDGILSAEDMIKAALERGCDSLGFSEHSHLEFDFYFALARDDTHKYAEEVTQLKEKYRGQIEIYLGLERDYYSDIEPDINFDYIIGTAHYFRKNDVNVCVDNGAEKQANAVKLHCGGDYYTFAEEYFAVMADIANKTKADIIGHFDLVAKFNIDGKYFDESHPRYIRAALSAMDEILKTCKIFEVNTGAMYRFGKVEPYPSVFLLKELQKRGGEVILSSDSHSPESLCYKFDEVSELLKSCNFKYIKRLTQDGFVDTKL
jgi:histidinol-phosphatase (PHP family)